MDYIEKTDNMSNDIQKNIMLNRYEDGRKQSGAEAHFFSSPAVSLTNYKKVVYKDKYYGMSLGDLEFVERKFDRQAKFLETHFYYDKIRGVHIPLKNMIISANHNPNRYHAQIQNIVNTLSGEAKDKNLKPIFMTLTLPSEYHRMKQNFFKTKMIPNEKFIDDEKHTPKEGAKKLTKMMSKLRNERTIRHIPKDQRLYYRVLEPHQDGTPHTHILMFVPEEYIPGIVKSFNRLFGDTKANDIQTDINNAAAYIMKYINKTLPMSKQEKLTPKEKYLNAWYSLHRINRFCSSRSIAPMSIYKLVNDKYSLKVLTKKLNDKDLNIYVDAKNRSKIMEIFDGDEMVYCRNINFTIVRTLCPGHDIEKD